MAKKRDYQTWGTGLPAGSEALADVDAFCEEMGKITRAEATRFILIAWSRARRGTLQHMWGFGSSGPAQVNVSMDQTPIPVAKEAGKRTHTNRNGTAAAQALDLD